MLAPNDARLLLREALKPNITIIDSQIGFDYEIYLIGHDDKAIGSIEICYDDGDFIELRVRK